MKTPALFFAIFISIYACQQERANPEVPASTQEDTIKKEYPPKANHATRHMAAIQTPVYVDTLWWPYNNTESLNSQTIEFKMHTTQDLDIAFDVSRVTVSYYFPDSTEMLAYPIYEDELMPIWSDLASD
ncbi:MAG: hypothetical protein KBC22_00725 [Candidatus Pacebacteria bacterium]|nr:hypothetical protein [Candidatus Paceibacterota bacterium]